MLKISSATGTLEFICYIFGYYPKASKSHLIVKSQYLETANVVFGNTKINLTLEGTRHLGAAIGNHPYKDKYVNELVTYLNNQPRLLSKIAEPSHNQHMQHSLVVLKVN